MIKIWKERYKKKKEKLEDSWNGKSFTTYKLSSFPSMMGKVAVFFFIIEICKLSRRPSPRSIYLLSNTIPIKLTILRQRHGMLIHNQSEKPFLFPGNTNIRQSQPTPIVSVLGLARRDRSLDRVKSNTSVDWNWHPFVKSRLVGARHSPGS